jgi:hypothetical protein
MRPQTYTMPSSLPPFGQPCGPAPSTATPKASFPQTVRYNDETVTRTKKGRIIQAMSHGHLVAPTYPKPTWDPVSKNLVKLGCDTPVNHIGIMLHRSDTCGDLWSNVFVELDGMARPGGGQFEFDKDVPTSIFGVPTRILKTRNKAGDVYGIDRTEIYADPFTGFVFLSTGLAIPDASDSLTGVQGLGVLLMSTDNGDSWKVVDEFPDSSQPLVMTSVKAGNAIRLFAVGSTSEDLEQGFHTYPHAYWYSVLPGSKTVTRLGDAAVYYTGPSGPLDMSEAIDPASGIETTFSRVISNPTVSRAPSDADLTRIRLAYSHADPTDGGLLEEIYVVQIAVPTLSTTSCSGASCRVGLANLAQIGRNLGVSAFFPHFIESNFIEHQPPPNDPRPDAALLKFIKRPLLLGDHAKIFLPAAQGFSGLFDQTGVFDLTPDYRPSSPFAGSTCASDADCGPGVCSVAEGFSEKRCVDSIGDYTYGAFFTRPDDPSVPRFLVPWQEADLTNALPSGKDRVVTREVVW